MTRQQETLLLIKGTISELEPAQQEVVKECVNYIRELLAKHPEGEALIAFALVGAELDAR